MNVHDGESENGVTDVGVRAPNRGQRRRVLTIRTKWIRAAHWGAVTRLINQMGEALLAADVGRLKRLRQSLKKKIDDNDVLLKLDEELLLSVGEDELDYEIEQADVVREREQSSP